MKYDGVITRVQRARGGVTLIIETAIGLRGVELDNELWLAIVADFKLGQADEIVGWRVEYDPAHGDLEIVGMVEVSEDEEDSSTANEGHDDHGDDRADEHG